MSHISMSHVPHMNESCPTYHIISHEWVISYHMHEFMYEWVISYFMHEFMYEWDISYHMNESYHITWISYVIAYEWDIHAYDKTHSYVWHDSRVTWYIHMSYHITWMSYIIAYEWVISYHLNFFWYDAFMCDEYDAFMCDVMMRYDAVMWCCDMTHSCVMNRMRSGVIYWIYWCDMMMR